MGTREGEWLRLRAGSEDTEWWVAPVPGTAAGSPLEPDPETTEAMRRQVQDLMDELS